MNKSLIAFIITTVLLLLPSCGSPNQSSLVSDAAILQTLFENHPPPVFSISDPSETMTFDEFSDSLTYKREDIDINTDGKREILLSGSTSFPYWAFYIIYLVDDKQQVQEMYYSEVVGWYSADVQSSINLPYVFVDFLTSTGGTGFFTSGSRRNIVRCVDTVCDSISYKYFSADTLGSYDYSSLDISGDQIEIKVSGFYVEMKPVSETACDATGNEYFSNEARNHYYVDTSYYYKYSWKDNHFLETDYQETPAFEVPGFFDGIYTGTIPSLIKESVKPDATIQQTLEAYFDLFGATTDERKSPPTFPCDEVNADSNWLPYSIPTTIHKTEDHNYFAAVNNMCKLVVWKENSDTFQSSLDDLEIVGRENLADCNPDFISFQWMNITASDTPELIITSGISKQTIWVYDVSESVKLLHQATGFSRENPLAGVQLQKISNSIILKVGLPRSNGQCLDAFKCFLFDKEFETFLWNNETHTFVPAP